jgi:hypothetical protein
LLDIRTLLLAVSALLLVVSALANLFDLARHPLHGPSEIGQLTSDARYVLFGCHVLSPILCGSRHGGSRKSLRQPRQHHEISMERDTLKPTDAKRRKPVLVLKSPELALD